ncbi:hypothetical protein CBD41_03245 [bacterium TMED181]|nr:hypothetical protein [Planctomycetota bacterium]OUW45926.1 MAG: hypothetical protein CBD41_03245 [bacterium TMED181]
MPSQTLRISPWFLIFVIVLLQGCHSPLPRAEALFDGKSLAGWQGFHSNPYQLKSLDPQERKNRQEKADETMRRHWSVVDGILCFDGKGQNLVSIHEFGDFELSLEWMITPGGDSGIYLRGCPQVQIWDSSLNPAGSGGLYNNQNGGAQPLEAADAPPGQWNHFKITLENDRVTVYLNDRLVVNDIPLENYWRRSEPIPSHGPIELQSHGTPLKFRNLMITRLRAMGLEDR